ncbi:hypothetical protein K8I85_10130, partial [bacterium]|nr:hypothetical protein [bacterium]
MSALRDRTVPGIAFLVLSAALALLAGPVSAETAAECAGVFRETAPLFRAQLPREADLGPFRVQMDSTVLPSDFDYVVELLSALLPYMEEIVGPPPFDSLSVWLDADLQYFSCTSGIHMDGIDRSRDYDNDGDGRIDEDPFDSVDNDGDGLVDEDLAYSPVWDNVFIHELTHAYQRELLCAAAYPSWITEGMAEAARHFVSERATRALGRKFQSRRFDRRMAVYDLYDSPGAQVLGGAGSIAGRFSFDVLYQNAAGAILVPALAQLTAGHESPHPLRRLSEELLREARGGSPFEMYEAVDRAWTAPVDGVFPPSRWLRGRAVTNRSVRTGEFVTLLPNYVANGVNPPRLHVDRFTRSEFEQIDPGPFPQGAVTFTDVGRRSFAAEGGPTLPVVPDLPPGAYLAEVTEPGSESGWPLSARSWILIVPPSFLEPSDRANVSVWKGVAAVFVDERGFPVDVPDVTVNGTIVGRVPGGLIAYPTSGSGGDLTFSRGGHVLGTVSVGESFRRMVVLHTEEEQARGLVSWEPYRPTAGSSVRVRLKHRESSLPF